MMTSEVINTVVRLWDIHLKTIRHDIELYGSPDRSSFRVAVEDKEDGIFVLEQIDAGRHRRRAFIGHILERLHAGGLEQVPPYLRTKTGDYLAPSNDAWWQLSPFVAGDDLDRPRYIHDAGKGISLAGFLENFYRHARKIKARDLPFFSLKEYLLKLEPQINQHDPDVGQRVKPVFDFLGGSFLAVHDTLPVAFCHGDFHPMNVIWRGDAVTAVIDWEFCGLKIDIYDVANLIGCVGMEHPSGLMDDLVLNFIREVRQTSVISEASWGFLVEVVIALRFAWLAEWLRNKDREMINLEEVYMKLLIDNRDKLQDAWNLQSG